MIITICDACARGEHWDCNLATWCGCEDDGDGNPDVYYYDYPGDVADVLAENLDAEEECECERDESRRIGELEQ